MRTSNSDSRLLAQPASPAPPNERARRSPAHTLHVPSLRDAPRVPQHDSQQQISAQNDEIRRLKQLQHLAEEDVNDLRQQLQQSQAAHIRSEDGLRDASKELEKLRREYEDNIMKAKLAQSRDEQQLCQARQTVAKLEGELQTRDAQLEKVRAMRNKLGGELQARDLQLAELKASRVGVGNSSAAAAELKQCQSEIQQLTKQLHEKTWALQREENEAEKVVAGYAHYIDRLAVSSAASVADQTLDLSAAEILGMGNYGYVVTCTQRASKERVVLKLQSSRWVDVAVREWAHGSEIGEHPHIVRFIDLLMHRDADDRIKSLIRQGFDGGTLHGRCPRTLPNTFLCTVLEYMDAGTISSLADSMGAEGVAACARQVASALAFMHRQRRTHNDIKPDNVLLRHAPGHLVVKLADLGLAAHSTERRRDAELFAYTLWCLCTRQDFHRLPAKADRERALADLRAAAPVGEKRRWTALADVVAGLWSGGIVDMIEVEARPEFQQCEVRPPDGGCAKQMEARARLDVLRRAVRSTTKMSALRKLHRADPATISIHTPKASPGASPGASAAVSPGASPRQSCGSSSAGESC